MPKYEVWWHDFENYNFYSSFEIEASDPKKACFKAENYIQGLSPHLRKHYCGLEIECLVDENETYYCPSLFLEDKALKRDQKFCEERKIKNKFEYNPSLGKYYPPPELVSILDEPSYVSKKIPTTIEKIELLIKGYLPFFPKLFLHSIHYDIYNGKLAIAKGERQITFSHEPHLIACSLVTVSEMIMDCLLSGANITHIIREKEKRTTDFKARVNKRTEFASDVYQFEPNGERIVKEFLLMKGGENAKI